MKRGLCKWCESWERIASSGEQGNCLDPQSPAYTGATECDHPPDYWPGQIQGPQPDPLNAFRPNLQR